MRMPFGKHKGVDLKDIPLAYLLWLHGKDNLYDDLAFAVATEIAYRRDIEVDKTQNDKEEFFGLIKKIYRELSTEYHPDKGGSTEAMQAINAFYYRLQQKMKKYE